MQLLVEKLLEYERVVDPQAEMVLQELCTQYENLIDQSLALVAESPSTGAAASEDAVSKRKLQEKDKEIKRLREQLS